MNHMHPLMQSLTGIMAVPGNSVKTDKGMPEISENLSKGSYWGQKGLYNFHAYAPEMDKIHCSFYFREAPPIGMTLENEEDAELRISYLDEFSEEDLETVYLLLTKMEKHHGFRHISFEEAKLFLEEAEKG